MTNADREKLIKADIASIENQVRHAFNQGYDMGLKEQKQKTVEMMLKAIINEFKEYQKEWLTSHNDIEFQPDEENLILGFIEDTAICFINEYTE